LGIRAFTVRVLNVACRGVLRVDVSGLDGLSLDVLHGVAGFPHVHTLRVVILHGAFYTWLFLQWIFYSGYFTVDILQWIFCSGYFAVDIFESISNAISIHLYIHVFKNPQKSPKPLRGPARQTPARYTMGRRPTHSPAKRANCHRSYGSSKGRPTPPYPPTLSDAL
jgi:hypothetical protein